MCSGWPFALEAMKTTESQGKCVWGQWGSEASEVGFSILILSFLGWFPGIIIVGCVGVTVNLLSIFFLSSLWKQLIMKLLCFPACSDHSALCDPSDPPSPAAAFTYLKIILCHGIKFLLSNGWLEQLGWIVDVFNYWWFKCPIWVWPCRLCDVCLWLFPPSPSSPYPWYPPLTPHYSGKIQMTLHIVQNYEVWITWFQIQFVAMGALAFFGAEGWSCFFFSLWYGRLDGWDEPCCCSCSCGFGKFLQLF